MVSFTKKLSLIVRALFFAATLFGVVMVIQAWSATVPEGAIALPTTPAAEVTALVYYIETWTPTPPPTPTGTDTPTPLPPTATPSPTDTKLPTSTATRVPPTATSTRRPPTATPTPLP